MRDRIRSGMLGSGDALDPNKTPSFGSWIFVVEEYGLRCGAAVSGSGGKLQQQGSHTS